LGMFGQKANAESRDARYTRDARGEDRGREASGEHKAQSSPPTQAGSAMGGHGTGHALGPIARSLWRMLCARMSDVVVIAACPLVVRFWSKYGVASRAWSKRARPRHDRTSADVPHVYAFRPPPPMLLTAGLLAARACDVHQYCLNHSWSDFSPLMSSSSGAPICDGPVRVGWSWVAAA